MRTTIRLLTISSVILLMLFTACGELFLHDIHHKLPDKYKTLVTDFDTVIFQSGALTDTFLVRKVTNSTYQEALSGTSCKGPYESWEGMSLHYFEINEFRKKLCGYGSNLDGGLYGECRGWDFPGCDNALNIVAGFWDKYSVSYFKTWLTQKKILNSYILTNKEYTDVYVFTSDQTESIISEIYFSSKYGLLQYTSNNNVYMLKK